MEISSHQQTHIHLDHGSPISRINVIARCIVLELENGDQLYLHMPSEAIQQIAAKAADS